MGSLEAQQKPHVVCVPHPAQGHMIPMMQLAKLLNSRGVHITFVLTDHNHARLLDTRGPHALDGLPSFRFASIPDGLPPSDGPQNLIAVCDSLDKNGVAPLTELLKGLEEGGGPPVSSIVADVGMAFTLEAAEAMGVKVVMFWTASAASILGYEQYPRLLREGYTPLKDASYLTNGYLDTQIDWIPSMKGIRLKDLPAFLRTTDPNDILFNFTKSIVERCHKASALIFNTFDALEHKFRATLAPDFPPLYFAGPMHVLVDRIHDEETKSIGCNLWKEDEHCLKWLDSKEPGSVVYVNFGSLMVITNDQLVEFAFGLANSGKEFLWVIRPDLVVGESAVLPAEFGEVTKERSLIVDWCAQERVLSHVAIGGFLTHCGWNSIMESVCAGVPMITWPFFADQQTNCWALVNEWGIGIEIDSDVKREVVEKQVRELMDGEKGKVMRRRAMEWKKLAENAIVEGEGESSKDLDKLVNNVLVSKN